MKYLDNDTFIHRLDPRTKIVLGLLGAVSLVTLKTPLSLALLFLCVLVFFAVVRPPRKTIWTTAMIMATALCFTMISQGFFYGLHPRTAILTLVPPDAGIAGRITGGIVLYREGLVYGALQSLRLFSAMLLSSIIVMSTYPSDLLLGMEELGVPEKIGFVVAVSIRFLPTLIEEAGRILLAQKLRGVHAKGVRGGFRAFRHLLPPLVIDSLRNARRTAIAAEIRAFTGKRTKVTALKFTRNDWLFLAFSIAGILILIFGQELQS